MFSTAVVFVWRVSEHPEVRPVEIVEAGHGGRVQGREVAGRQLIRAAAAARVPGRGCNIQRQGHAFMEYWLYKSLTYVAELGPRHVANVLLIFWQCLSSDNNTEITENILPWELFVIRK